MADTTLMELFDLKFLPEIAIKIPFPGNDYNKWPGGLRGMELSMKTLLLTPE